MPKYEIIIRFETDEPLPEKILDRVAADAFVQLEALDDGDYGKKYKYNNSDFEVHTGSDSGKRK